MIKHLFASYQVLLLEVFVQQRTQSYKGKNRNTQRQTIMEVCDHTDLAAGQSSQVNEIIKPLALEIVEEVLNYLEGKP